MLKLFCWQITFYQQIGVTEGLTFMCLNTYISLKMFDLIVTLNLVKSNFIK